MVSGAFGGTGLARFGMTIAGMATSFSGSVVGDLINDGIFESINWKNAVWFGLLGGLISCIGGPGAQHGKLDGISKYSMRLKTCKEKEIKGRYLRNTMKYLNREKSKAIYAAKLEIYKSIPYTIGSNIVDYYL